MESILFYFAQVLLLICSMMLGFVESMQTYIMCISCLLTGFLLMWAYAIKVKVHWPGFCLYAMVVFCHLFYLSANTAYSAFVMVFLTLFVILAFASAFFFLKGTFFVKRSLTFVLFEKIALTPEFLLNYLISRQSGNPMFANFSWILLAVTSIHAIFCIHKMIRAKIVSQSWGIALGVLQFFFVTDILSTATLLILMNKADPSSFFKRHHRRKEEEEPQKSARKVKKLKLKKIDFKNDE